MCVSFTSPCVHCTHCVCPIHIPVKVNCAEYAIARARALSHSTLIPFIHFYHISCDESTGRKIQSNHRSGAMSVAVCVCVVEFVVIGNCQSQYALVAQHQKEFAWKYVWPENPKPVFLPTNSFILSSIFLFLKQKKLCWSWRAQQCRSPTTFLLCHCNISPTFIFMIHRRRSRNRGSSNSNSTTSHNRIFHIIHSQ